MKRLGFFQNRIIVMTYRTVLRIILTLALCFAGCGTTVDKPKPEQPIEHWYDNEEDPLGTICQDGLDLYIEFLETDGSQVSADKIKEHCKTCEGCMKSFYTPDRWKEFK